MALMLLYGAETHRRRVDHLTGSEGADLLYQTGYDEGLEGQPEALPGGSSGRPPEESRAPVLDRHRL